MWAGREQRRGPRVQAPLAGGGYGVASARDEVLQLQPGRPAERILGCRCWQATPAPGCSRRCTTCSTGRCSSACSPDRERARRVAMAWGSRLARGGAIISVDVAAKRFTWTVRGLTAPTDFVIASEASIYVLELCDAFVDPVTRAGLLAGPRPRRGPTLLGKAAARGSHAPPGDADVATELDTPTDLALSHVGFGVSKGRPSSSWPEGVGRAARSPDSGRRWRCPAHRVHRAPTARAR